MTVESAPQWDPTRQLVAGEHVLIQASAGTGKTYQTEGLVVRLVAEQGVPIGRILVITFTRAATAELRSRVRGRLVAAGEALRCGEPGGDVIAQHLLALRSVERAQAAENLKQALRDFDQAPISTIHGFCQRTLEQLGFSAGVEPALAVLGEAGELREQIVADTLAQLFTQASTEQVAVLADLGWRREILAAIAKSMTGAEEPVVEPGVADMDDPVGWVVGRASRWVRELNGFRDWLADPEGQAACSAYQSEPWGKKCRFLRFSKIVVRDLRAWLDKGAPYKGRVGRKSLRWATTAMLDQGWRAATGSPAADFGGYPLAERFTALAELQDKLWCGALTPFATTVRARFHALLERRGLLSYDTILSLLAERLEHDGPLAKAMHEQYDAAIVDEFQDTDGAQWGILERVFLAKDKRLYVVGDPKQAIYRFRNANLAVYDCAAAEMDAHSLAINWRSDGPFVKAIEQIWSGASEPFEHEGIHFESVAAAHKRARIRGLPALAAGGKPVERARRPVELRWFDGEMTQGESTDLANKEDATAAIAKLCATECRALLESGAELQDEDGDQTRWRPLRPGDLAVLTRMHKEGEAVRAALASHGIPAIKTSQQGVTGSEVVPWVLSWLDAVAAPGVEGAARALALTPLCGWTPAKLARALSDLPKEGAEDDAGEADRQDWALLLSDIGTWAHNWTRHGFARAFDAALDQYGTLPRILQGPHGERAATDIRHVCELLHLEERRSHAGPRVLAQWLRAQQVEKTDEDSDLAQRLESDASAVKIETIHGSKGLQYPVVLAPFAWTTFGGRDGGKPIRYSRRKGTEVELVLDLNPLGSDARKKANDLAKAEDEQESMRLLYVAMTRARHHLVLWAGARDGSQNSAIGRLLFKRQAGGSGPQFKKVTKKHSKKKAQGQLAAGTEALQALCDASGGTVGWSTCAAPESGPAQRWQPRDQQLGDAASPLPAAVTPWDPERPLGACWLIASYTSLSAGKASDADEPTQRSADQPAGSSVGPDLQADPRFAPAAALDLAALDAELLELAAAHDLPGGTSTGDWLHGVLEHLDFAHGGAAAKDGRPAAELVAQLGLRNGVRADRWHGRALELLPAWLSTPLDAPFPSGPGLPAGYTLSALAREDRLDELRFDLRLGQGVKWQPHMRAQPGGFFGRIHPAGVRRALDDALRDPGFGGRVWLADLLQRTPAGEKRVLPAIAGLLMGFVDLCFRVGGANGRYFICDYKSNVLQGPETVRAWHLEQPLAETGKRPRVRRAHYTRPMMAWGMSHAAYHLQALVYTVALHRLLKLRLGSDYSYDRHIGGHLYLFLRGMEGPQTPRFDGAPLGVWADRWPARTVVGLDAALDGGDERAVAAAMDRETGGGR